MCIIVHIPTNQPPPSETILKGCYQKNPDYCGFMWAENEKVSVRRFRKFEEFYRTFLEEHRRVGGESPMTIHFRLASAGSVSMDNAHPFKVSDQLAFVHNGTINKAEMDKEYPNVHMSDTHKLNKFIMKHLPPDFQDHPELMALLASFTSPSRLLIMRGDKKVSIIGDNVYGANWKNGCWYSCAIPTYVPPKEIVVAAKPPATKHSLCDSCNVFTKVSAVSYEGVSVYLCNDCNDDYHEFMENNDKTEVEDAEIVQEVDLAEKYSLEHPGEDGDFWFSYCGGKVN